MVEVSPFIGMLVFFAYLFVLDIDFSRVRARGVACILRLQGVIGKASSDGPAEHGPEDDGSAADHVVQFEDLIARSYRHGAFDGSVGDKTREKPSQ
ncbi:hypothetical protein [Tropicimonas sediminicola]|uniref:Uncharacterized protein n=1 Tax=Tropicimonas sediminicola TaxID=1031541 RepID=A0A239KFU5_9RHOB|nr:hypothetical protein [Tropicimonas sediminicola]SNT17051.1 hypothetical protein SAMN05421757_10788 [Tropicimonas sediminicola]